MGLVIAKGGGSVLTNGEQFRRFASYCVQHNAVALMSAMNGLTNEFQDMYGEMSSNHHHILQQYKEVLRQLPAPLRNAALDELNEDLRLLETYLHIGAMDAFVGAPEGHSAIMLKYHLKAQGRDAECLNGPDAGFFLNGHGLIDMGQTPETLKHTVGDILRAGRMAVVGGYLGFDDGKRYKIGARNINDAYAAALGVALGAERIDIVKDEPGVYHVPPKEYGDFGMLTRLSYDEARKISRSGSPVVHPSAIQIARDHALPLYVRDMTSAGTVIDAATQTTPSRPVAALVPDVAFMVTVLDDIMDTPEGRGYLAAIHTFERDYGADIGSIAADVGGVSYTVSLGDRKRNEDNGARKEDHNRRLEAHLNGLGYRPQVRGEPVGVITIVGDSMQQRMGTFSYLSGILSREGISLLAAMQSNEKYAPPSITFVVDEANLTPSVEALADELFATA